MTMAYQVSRPPERLSSLASLPSARRFLILAIAFPASNKRVVGLIHGGDLTERDILRVLSLYRQGRLDLNSQIGARIQME